MSVIFRALATLFLSVSLCACGIGGADPGPRILSGSLSSTKPHNETVELLNTAFAKEGIDLVSASVKENQLTRLIYTENGFRILVNVSSASNVQNISITGTYYDGRTRGALSYFVLSDSMEDADPDFLKSLISKYNSAYTSFAGEEGIVPFVIYTLEKCEVYEEGNLRPCVTH